MSTVPNDRLSSRYLFVLIATCGMTAASMGMTFNIAGLFYNSMAESLQVGRGSVALAMTICSLVSSVAAIIVPRIVNEKNLKLFLLIGTVCLAGGTFLLSISPNLFLIYLLAVVRGIGAGMLSMVFCTMILNNWFFARHGVITSVMMAFSGVPGMLLSSMFSGIIASSGWRQGYLVCALIQLGFCLPALLLPMTIRPQTAGMKPYGYDLFMKMKDEGKTVRISTDTSDFNFSSPLFLLAAFFAVLCCVAAALPQFFPGISEEFGQGAALGAVMLSVGMGVNIVAKILFGILTDRYGAKPAMLVMSTLSTLGLFGIFLLHSRYGLLGGAMLFTFIYGNSALGVAMMASDLFGPENYNKVYPTLSLAGGVANAGAGTLIGLLYDGTGSYVSAILLVLVSEALIIFCILTAYLLKKRISVSNA